MTSAQLRSSLALGPLTFTTVARTAAVAALVGMIPFNAIFLTLIAPQNPLVEKNVVIGPDLAPTDLILVLLIALAVPMLPGLIRSRTPGVGLVGVMALSGVIAAHLLFEPTLQGAMLLLRTAGAAALIVMLRSMDPRLLALSVAWPLAVVASFQAALALSQTLIFGNGNPITNEAGELVTTWTRGYGTMIGAYDLAAFLTLTIAIMLSMRRFRSLVPIWWLTVIAGSATIAVSFGRSGVLSVVLIAVVYIGYGLWDRSTALIRNGFIALLPMITVGLVLRSGWWVRAVDTAQLSSTGRIELMERALDTIASHPLIGVGPMQYGTYISQLRPSVADRHIVHNVPLLITAEFGVVVGVAAIAWAIALGYRAFRTSVFAAGILVSIVPFFMFDHLHYTHPSALATAGLWVALLDFHWHSEKSEDAISSSAQQ